MTRKVKNVSNSSMVVYTKISPNKTVNRNHTVDRITPHCVVGQVTAESLGDWFAKGSTRASSNYGIDKNARVGMYVEEKDRSWCSSSAANDNRAITIECASDTTAPYAMKGIVYERLIELCVDICRRYGKTKLLWIADKNRALNYKLASDEMLITVHRWFAITDCPGDWLYERLGDLAAKVTTKLNSKVEPSDEEPKEEVKSAAKYYVQTGAFSQLKNAKDMVAKLKAAGFNAVIKDEANKIVDVKGAEHKHFVGDVVKFTGYKQFASANSSIVHEAVAGEAKITAFLEGSKHPYHLIRTGDSGPYGWVDEGTFSKI